GFVMGFVVLTIFSDETAKQTTASNVSNSANQVNQSDDQPEESTSSQDAQLPELDFTMNIVQGAAFSSDGNSQDAVEKLQKDGYPAVLYDDGETVYLFIGAANDKQQAKELANQYNKD